MPDARSTRLLRGSNRPVMRQGKGDTGEDVSYQQCERCLHYPRPVVLASAGLRWEPCPPEYQGGSGGVGSGQ